MNEADLGIRVFLIDNLSSPMGIVSGAMALLGASLVNNVAAVGAASASYLGLQEEMLVTRDAIEATQLSQTGIEEAFLAGNLTLQEAGDLWQSGDLALRGLNDDMEQAEADSQYLAEGISGLNDTLTVLGAALGAGIDFAAFALGIDQTVQAASQLQDTMQNLSIAGSLTNDQLAQMQTYLFQVAQSSIYSADTVGQGFTMLLERGQSVATIMGGLGQDAVNLAEAMGQTGVTGAATLLSSTMQIFGIQANQARQTADQLTYAFYHGIPSVDGMTAAMNATGGMANAMHVPLSELLTMLDALGQAGLSGSQAGTAMRYMLQSMYEPTQKQANELQTLGIITANEVTPAFQNWYDTIKAEGDSTAPVFDGTINSLYNIWAQAKAVGDLPVSSTFLQWGDSLGMITDKFYGANGQQLDFMKAFGILVESIQANSKTPAAFADALGQMFNVRSGQGFADILGKVSTLTQKQKDLLESEYKTGLAAEDAQKQTATLSGAWKALTTTVQDFLSQVGNALIGPLTIISGALNTIMSNMTTSKTQQVQKFFTAFLISGAVLSGLVLLAGIILAIGGTFGTLGVVIGVIIGVMAGIGLSAAAIGAAWVWLQGVWKHVMDFLSPFIKVIQNLWQNMDFPELLRQLGGAWDNLMKALKPVLPYLEMIGVVIAVVLVVAIVGIIGFLILFLRAILVLVTGFINLISWILNVVGHINTFASAFTNAGSVAGGAMMTFWHFLQGVFGMISNAFNGLIGQGGGFGAQLIGNFITGIKNAVGGLFSAIGSMMQGVKNLMGFGSPTKEGPGRDADTWMPNLMNMMVHGVVSGTPALKSAAGNAAGALHSSFTSPTVQGLQGSSGAGGVGGNITIPLYMDSTVIGTLVVNRLSGQLQMSGINRTGR